MKWPMMVVALALAAVAAAPVAAKNDASKRLPPGLQKKGELPPGWQKKLARGRILDEEVYRYGVVSRPEDSQGVITIKVEGKIIRVLRATREILDVI